MPNDGWDAQAVTELTVIGPNGDYIKLYFSQGVGPVMTLQPPNRVGWIYDTAHILATDDAQKPWLDIESPLVVDDPGPGGPFRHTTIRLYGESSFQSAQIEYDADVHLFQGTVRADRVIANDIQVVNSGAIGAAETVVLTAQDPVTLASAVYRANRAYKVEVQGMNTVSVANNDTLFRIRKTNAAGQQFQASRQTVATLTAHETGFEAGFVVGAANVTADIVLTLTGGGGYTTAQVAAATSPRTIIIYDDGAAATHVGWPTLV